MAKTVKINGKYFKVTGRAGSKFGDIVWLEPLKGPKETTWVYAKEIEA